MKLFGVAREKLFEQGGATQKRSPIENYGEKKYRARYSK